MFPYKIVDLTHELTSNIPSWNEKCGFQHEIELDYKDCNTAVKFQVQNLKMSAGIGTHIDAPAHIIPGGKTIDELPLQDLLAPCIVIDISAIAHENYSLSVQDILNFEEKHGKIPPRHFVMIKTGWEKLWQNPLKYRNNLKFPSVSKEATELLLEKKIGS